MAFDLMDFLFGSKGKTERISTLGPEQADYKKQLYKILLGGGEDGGGVNPLQFLKDMLDPESQAFSGIEDRARHQFETRTAPNIAERFAGQGALSSSGFGQALGAGAADLESNLAALGDQRQQGSLQEILKLLTGATQDPEFAIQQTPGSPGFLAQAVGAGTRKFFS